MEVGVVFANIQLDSTFLTTVHGGTQEDASQSLPRFRAHASCGSLVFSPFLDMSSSKPGQKTIQTKLVRGCVRCG